MYNTTVDLVSCAFCRALSYVSCLRCEAVVPLGPHNDMQYTNSVSLVFTAKSTLYIILVVLFKKIFSVHQIFDVPGPIFAKVCHTTQYGLI